MDFLDIENRVLSWAEDRSIFKQSNSIHQFGKLMEEAEELLMGLRDEDQDEIIDAIGDMLVVLTLIAYFNCTNLTHCFETAYNEIKDRKGTMINGKFVKEQ